MTTAADDQGEDIAAEDAVLEFESGIEEEIVIEKDTEREDGDATCAFANSGKCVVNGFKVDACFCTEQAQENGDNKGIFDDFN